jgi:crotonobetainyl-CoA:carnitine CoA-transferase CaiB-like acyl-CoA transferase
MGAEVIKVEMPPNGDSTRSLGPFLSGKEDLENSALFLHNNTGKKSVLLDWSTASGSKALESILSGADIFIEDWDATYRETTGIDRERFTSCHPELIEICITPFGLDGPYSHWKSSPIVQFALGGIMNIIGDLKSGPLMIPGHHPEYLTGINGCNASVIALWERDFSGNGAFLELSELETLANVHQAPLNMEGGVRKRNSHRQSSLSARGFPPGVATLAAKDGYLTFGGGSQAIWEQLCLMLERTDLYEGKDFSDLTSNEDLEELVDRIIENWMDGKMRSEVFREVSEEWLLPVAPVLSICEVLSDKQFMHRSSFQEIDHPSVGKASYPLPHPLIDGDRLPLSRAPLLGEHTKAYI